MVLRREIQCLREEKDQLRNVIRHLTIGSESTACDTLLRLRRDKTLSAVLEEAKSCPQDDRDDAVGAGDDICSNSALEPSSTHLEAEPWRNQQDTQELANSTMTALDPKSNISWLDTQAWIGDDGQTTGLPGIPNASLAPDADTHAWHINGAWDVYSTMLDDGIWPVCRVTQAVESSYTTQSQAYP